MGLVPGLCPFHENPPELKLSSNKRKAKMTKEERERAAGHLHCAYQIRGSTSTLLLSVLSMDTPTHSRIQKVLISVCFRETLANNQLRGPRNLIVINAKAECELSNIYGRRRKDIGGGVANGRKLFPRVEGSLITVDFALKQLTPLACVGVLRHVRVLAGAIILLPLISCTVWRLERAASAIQSWPRCDFN